MPGGLRAGGRVIGIHAARVRLGRRVLIQFEPRNRKPNAGSARASSICHGPEVLSVSHAVRVPRANAEPPPAVREKKCDPNPRPNRAVGAGDRMDTASDMGEPERQKATAQHGANLPAWNSRGHGTTSVSPGSLGGISPPVSSRGETPRELAGGTPAAPKRNRTLPGEPLAPAGCDRSPSAARWSAEGRRSIPNRRAGGRRYGRGRSHSGAMARRGPGLSLCQRRAKWFSVPRCPTHL